MTRPLLVLAAFAVAGCGNAGPPAAVTVHGNVSLDGASLSDGVVEFVSPNGRPPRQMTVTAGRFEGSVVPGKYAVAVKAYRLMKNPPPTNPAAPIDPHEQYLPARYNTKTELSADVTAGGPELKFELKSGSVKKPVEVKKVVND